MQKILVKISRVFTCLLFLCLLLASIIWVNHVVVEKETNRYYMLSKDIQSKEGPFDVEVFGSCHAYTSFNPIQFAEQYGYTAYNMANPSEVIPISYVRMRNAFRRNAPRVALVETWGIHPYNTYLDEDQIMRYYSPLNVDNLPLTKEKNVLIKEFDTLDLWIDNFPLAKYKNRIVENTLHEFDFAYSFERIMEERKKNGDDSYPWLYDEMENRMTHNGGRVYGFNALETIDPERMNVHDTELELDETILSYVDKIIALCEEYDVQLIFYRAPYAANSIELKQDNYLRTYLAEKGIPYYNLEENISFNANVDFWDTNHLGANGNRKVTDFLGGKIALLLAEDE